MSAPDRSAALLEVDHLSVSYETSQGMVRAVSDAQLRIAPGERVALVGESGSGKSTMAHSFTRLVESMGGTIDPASRMSFDGRDVMALKPKELRRMRGRAIGMIFQDPMTSLNPAYRVGDQIVEAIRIHSPSTSRADARARAAKLLERMGIASAQARLASYPHEFSGGMRQRAMIALALSCSPSLLIADEPTTALDVTTQAQIMLLLQELVAEDRLAVLLITHDLSIVAGFADRTLVMYGGRIAESGPTDDVFARPEHPYTAGLIGAVPRLDHARARQLAVVPGRPVSFRAMPTGCPFHPRCVLNDKSSCVHIVPALEAHTRPSQLSACHHPGEAWKPNGAHEPVPAATPRRASRGDALVELHDLTKVFRGYGPAFARRRDPTVAVDAVSLSIRQGESFGLVGESGSGKTTLGRCILRLIEPTSGTVWFDGNNVSTLDRTRLRALRRDMQMIFQDPHASLDPRLRVEDLIAEPMRIHGLWGRTGYDRMRVLELLETVGLNPDAAQRFPAAFSGGERQRIGIARALAIRPKFIVCDEPVSSLDVSIRAQIINLLIDLQDEFGLTYLFIAHDLALVHHTCDRVAVMRNGEIVEVADRDSLYRSPKHPYTKALLNAIPIPEPVLERQRLAARP